MGLISRVSSRTYREIGRLKMAGFKPVTHVIFDMDGLLINTEDLYTNLFDAICADYGKTYTYELKIKLMGRRPLDAMEIMMKELDMSGVTAQELLDKSHSMQPTYFAEAALLPGAARLINHLSNHGIPMSICTGSSIRRLILRRMERRRCWSCSGRC